MNKFSQLEKLCLLIGVAPSAFAAFSMAPLGQPLPFTLDCAHWYVGANLGLSHLHDDPNPGTSNCRSGGESFNG